MLLRTQKINRRKIQCNGVYTLILSSQFQRGNETNSETLSYSIIVNDKPLEVLSNFGFESGRFKWKGKVELTSDYPFLKLWYEVSSEANDFIMHEMIRKTNLMQSAFNYYYLDETFGMEDNFEERSDKREKKGLPELDFSIKEYSEEIKKYLPILFEEYVNRLYDESVECDEPEDKNYLMFNLAGGVYNRLVRNEIALEEEAKG